MAKEVALVYMVAGLSSRFGGKIKQFANVGPDGESLIEYSLKQALPAGFSKIVFIVGEKTEKPFRDMFGEEYNGVKVFYALQKYDDSVRDKPWGTVDALYSAREFLDCNFVVCNGDDLYGEEAFRRLVEHFRINENCASIGYKLKGVLPDDGSVNRGIFEIDSEGNVRSIKEVFDISKDNFESKDLNVDSLCSMNIFGLSSDVLSRLDEALSDFKEKNKGDRKVECLLPVEIGRLIEQRSLEMSLYSTNDKWFGVTNPRDEEIVKRELERL